MSATVLCAGCGLQVPVPPDHTRPKLRCPECGVMCDVPQEVRDKAAQLVAKPPLPFPSPLVEEREKEPEPPLQTSSETILCQTCGELVWAPKGKKVKSWRCPVCGAPAEPEHVPRSEDLRPPLGALASPEVPKASAQENDLLYGLSGQAERRCPVCSAVLPPEAVLCVRCGLDLRTRQKVARTYQPIRRQWEPGLKAKVRWTLFLAFMALEAAVVVRILLAEGDLCVTLFSWGLFTVLLAFLLGTFNRIDVERNKRGQARIRRTWHVCFVIRRSGIIPWHEYEGVVTGKTRLVGLEDWLVVLALLPLGLVPAILWWYYVIERDRYTVALARHHGFPEELLYCGYSPELCAELAQTIRNATGLPLSSA